MSAGHDMFIHCGAAPRLHASCNTPSPRLRRAYPLFDDLPLDVLDRLVAWLGFPDIHNLRRAGAGSRCRATHERLGTHVRRMAAELRNVLHVLPLDALAPVHPVDPCGPFRWRRAEVRELLGHLAVRSPVPRDVCDGKRETGSSGTGGEQDDQRDDRSDDPVANWLSAPRTSAWPPRPSALTGMCDIALAHLTPGAAVALARHLPALHTLDLSHPGARAHASFAWARHRALPSELSLCTRLETLHLSRHDLCAVPPAVLTLSRLHTLALDHNPRLCSLPCDIGRRLKRLARLDVRGCPIAQWPASLLDTLERNVCARRAAGRDESNAVEC